MWESLGEKRQSIKKIMIIGILILTVCLAVCFSLVFVLRFTYNDEISTDFQAHHVSSGEMLDASIRSGIDVVESAAAVLGNSAYSYNTIKIYSVLYDFNNFDILDSIAFIRQDGSIFYNDAEYSAASIGRSIDFLLEEPANGRRTITDVSTYENSDGHPYIWFAAPVYYRDEFCGYLTATMKIYDIFEGEEFNYQRDMGECYLTDQNGKILARSSDSVFVPEESDDFGISMLEYSNGREISKRAIQTLYTAYKKDETGFVTIVTRKGESLQISYCPVASVDNLYFISCYDDNLVDDKVQPLIFRSVLSCIIIVVLMIAVIVYVWATAKRANITIEKLAYEDPVTKGKNLNYFMEFTENVLLSYRETPFIIYRFDIANFRYINEAYGHIRADEILASCIRHFGDIFSEIEICVRMDADQFLAMVKNDQQLEKRLDDLRKRVNEDARGRGIKYPIRFKMGVCHVRKHSYDIEMMIDRANVARKTLTSEGNDMVAYYSEKIVQNMRKLDRIESDMQRALANGEFKVFMQPKWDIKEDHIAGAEALVRWIKPDGSMVYPDEFIPVFENNGFIEKIDFYMLEMVCQKMSELIEAGKKVYPVSVNQSRILLHSADYIATVKRILQKYKLPENIIELEITETVFLDERDNMIDTINQLRGCGVRLAMDDFGSGYSSLNMLKDISFDTIKIDREFFTETSNSDRNKWILQSIIELVSGLGMEVLCEGVENEEQVQLLRSLGCHKVQGYYYSKPISEAEYIELYCN